MALEATWQLESQLNTRWVISIWNLFKKRRSFLLIFFIRIHHIHMKFKFQRTPIAWAACGLTRNLSLVCRGGEVLLTNSAGECVIFPDSLTKKFAPKMWFFLLQITPLFSTDGMINEYPILDADSTLRTADVFRKHVCGSQATLIPESTKSYPILDQNGRSHWKAVKIHTP